MPVKKVIKVEIPAMRSELYKGNQSIVSRSNYKALPRAAYYTLKKEPRPSAPFHEERGENLEGLFLRD